MEFEVGDIGRAVAKLQEALRNEGFDIVVDGDFGTETRDAVRAYQQREGLAVDGKAGTDTLTALGLETLLILLRRGDRGINVRKLQEALASAGLALALDGVYGADTENAVRTFQQGEGLGVDGIAGPNTLVALGLDLKVNVSTEYKICPGIGIARIGTSDQMFIGPESPFEPVTGPFKESGRIKKQGARFRIYEFEVDEFGHEVLTQELMDSSTVTIKWRVHLCNKKAASRTVPKETAGGSTPDRNPLYDKAELVMEAIEELSGVNNRSPDMVDTIRFIKAGVLEGEDSVVLGRLETDNRGRLIVVGGNGVSKSPLNKPLTGFANNAGWYDDLCDGPVHATVTVDGQEKQAKGAWVVVASPAYAPEIDNVVTWYDQAKNVEATHFDPMLMDAQPSFTDDIYPILMRISLLQWVSEDAALGHSTGSGGDFVASAVLAQLADKSSLASGAARQAIFERLMPPDTSAPSPDIKPPGTGPLRDMDMPYLRSGVDPVDRSKFQYFSLTRLQYDRMKMWANGNFVSDWNGVPPQRALDDVPLGERPGALSRAALEDCIGGPFYPGIETTYLMALSGTYKEPYRIDQTLPPGHLTELMALPWQADFYDCGQLWWPAQRPVKVRTSAASSAVDYDRGINSRSDMVQHWNELGFVVRDGNAYIEDERGSIP